MTDHGLGQLATRSPLSPPSEPQRAWLWIGHLDQERGGCHYPFTLRLLTTDPDLEVYSSSAFSPKARGRRWRLSSTNSYSEMTWDERYGDAP